MNVVELVEVFRKRANWARRQAEHFQDSRWDIEAEIWEEAAKIAENNLGKGTHWNYDQHKENGID